MTDAVAITIEFHLVATIIAYVRFDSLQGVASVFIIKCLNAKAHIKFTNELKAQMK